MKATWLYKRVKLQPLQDNKWVLLEQFTYYVGYKDSDNPINIEAGFTFNGTSIPRIFHWFSTPMDTGTLIASICHDKIFNTKELRKKYSLQDANDIFYEVMVVCWVGKFKAILLYLWLSLWSWYIRKKKNKSSL